MKKAFIFLCVFTMAVLLTASVKAEEDFSQKAEKAFILSLESDFGSYISGENFFSFTPEYGGKYKFSISRSYSDFSLQLYEADGSIMSSETGEDCLSAVLEAESCYYLQLYSQNDAFIFTGVEVADITPAKDIPFSRRIKNAVELSFGQYAENSGRQEVFFSFTPEYDGKYKFEKASYSDLPFELYDENGAVTDYVAGSDSLTAELKAGNSYYFCIYAETAEAYLYEYALLTDVTPPAEKPFSKRIEKAVSLAPEQTSSNSGRQEIFFSFVPEKSGCYEFSFDISDNCGVTLYDQAGLPLEPYITNDSGLFTALLEENQLYYLCIGCENENSYIFSDAGVRFVILTTPGDVDGDGSVSSADARIALRLSVNLDTATQELRKHADVDGDGSISSADARLILRVAVSIEESSAFKKFELKQSDGSYKKYTVVLEKTLYEGETAALPLPLSRAGQTLSWSSSNPDCLITENGGRIKAVKRGYACVTADFGEEKFYFEINVRNELQRKIDALRDKYPHGYYWNAHTASEKYPAVSEIPCTDHQKGNVYCTGQCAGFAALLNREIFGSSAPLSYGVSKQSAKIGDYIRLAPHHSIFITDVIKKGDIVGYNFYLGENYTAGSDYFIAAHCNWYGDCGILWDYSFTLDNIIPSYSYTRY